ncbi:LysM peptidoglycan-binding domain-containing protein [Kocuria sp. cx-116]|uniref:LysM peptidoglycan-binding domain-containing protein n=1 Tax=Kocuria sp. cx-116 TaxID=2771378 RepID=UPI001CC232F8|nr:transglycosylase family protein [Kocuria sp. cx-116]
MKTSNMIRRGAAALVIGGAAVGAMAMPANAAPSTDLGAIKQCESGGDYQAVNASSGASGAYQFLTSTWQSMGATTAGYATAADAPAAVQDKAAAELMARSGASQWECSSMIASGSYSAPATSVAPQASSVAPAAVEAPAAPEAEAPVAAPAAPAEAPAAEAAAPAAVEYTAPAADVAPAASTGSSYTVQAGDTLGSIAAKLDVNGGWEALYASNAGAVADANLIFPGQVLNIPA